MTQYRQKLDKAAAQFAFIQKQKETQEAKHKSLVERMENGLIPAQAFLQKVAQETQQTIQMHITNIVQLALDAVFPDTYEFAIEFEMKRGKTEARMFLRQDGKEMDPMDSNGGGVVDILALALRVSAYTLGKTRNVLILDEPMRFVSQDLQEQAAEMLRELSHKLNLQMIIITHSNEIIDAADKVFLVRKQGLKSIVQEKDCE